MGVCVCVWGGGGMLFSRYSGNGNVMKFKFKGFEEESFEEESF